MTKEKKQSIMIHKVNNGFMIGVVRKKEAGRLFNSGDSCKELYIAQTETDVTKQIAKILPELVMIDDVEEVEDDD